MYGVNGEIQKIMQEEVINVWEEGSFCEERKDFWPLVWKYLTAEEENINTNETICRIPNTPYIM